MIIFILCVIIGIYIGYKKSKKEEIFIKVVDTLLGAVAGALVGILLATGLFLVTVSPHTTQLFEFEKTELVVLCGSSESQGSFFLDSGSVGINQHYKFYFKTSDGGKKFGKLPAESVIIYEEERGDAYMAKIGKQDKYSDKVYFWLIPRFLMGECSQQGLYAIHVPKGTIKTGYNLDLN